MATIFNVVAANEIWIANTFSIHHNTSFYQIKEVNLKLNTWKQFKKNESAIILIVSIVRHTLSRPLTMSWIMSVQSWIVLLEIKAVMMNNISIERNVNRAQAKM